MPLRRGRSATRNAAEAVDLQCPLCIDLPTDEVHTCTNGHLFCGDCLGRHREQHYSGAHKCPTCRVALGDKTMRNLDAERRIGLLPGECDGCGAGMLRKDLKLHMAMCPDVQVNCPFPGCTACMPRRDLAAHLAEAQDAHIELAQSHHKRLTAAEAALGALTVSVQIQFYRDRDVLEGEWAGQPFLVTEIELKVMEPIEQQDDFINAIVENGLDFTTVRALSIDPRKSPFELGVENVSILCVCMTHAGRFAEERSSGANLYSHDPEEQSLNLKVETPTGDEIFFRIKINTPLQRLMQAFCNRQGRTIDSVRFFFSDTRILPDQRPMDLEMEDGDVIDATYVP